MIGVKNRAISLCLKNKFAPIVAIIAIIFNFSCSPANNEKVLRIAVTANLRFAMDSIDLVFEKETGLKLEISSASSGNLAAQIKNGAPFDVFISADKKYAEALFLDSLTIGKPVFFCEGILILWTRKDMVPDSLLKFLTRSEIKKIAIANSKNAPYGIAALEVLNHLNLYHSIQYKLVYAENVSQLNQYLIGEMVDVGFTSKSAVLLPELTHKGNWIEVNPNLYNPINQYIVQLKSKKGANENAKKYIDFILSAKAQQILKEFGYKTKGLD